MSSKPGKQRYWPITLLLLAGCVAIFAEAGPVWQRLPQPVYQQQSAMVIALDLSRSMDAEDVKPGRLQRAQFKLRDLLALRKEGQTALIVYANDAFTVTPLTDDSNTMAAMVPGLATNLLPEWQAAAHYRAGDFDQAVHNLNGINSSDAHYNRGNALAKAGNIDAAIKAYDDALSINPENEDALYNRQLMQKQKEQQQSGQQGDSSDKTKSGDQNTDAKNSQPSGKQESDTSPPGQAQTPDNQSDQSDSANRHEANSESTTRETDDKQSKSANHPSPQPSPTRGEGDKHNSEQLTADKPDMTKQATDQWLQKIPDDPGGLLRRKFKYQYQQQSKHSQGNAW